jgi:Family of unknown function (DUF5824)
MKSVRAPKKDRIKGSLTNKVLSASTKRNSIVFSETLTNSIKSIIKGTNTSLSTAKAVVRRGFGAYSTSHRPNVSRTAWGLARLKQFVKKNAGLKVNSKYVQDDDLLN